MLKNRAFSHVDSKGFSGWLISGWIAKVSAISSSSFPSAILVKLCFKFFALISSFLNPYGPYTDRDAYKEGLVVMEQYIIIGGYLKFTLGLWKVWGPSPYLDPLHCFLLDLLVKNHLTDFELVKLFATCMNGRLG